MGLILWQVLNSCSPTIDINSLTGNESPGFRHVHYFGAK